ncbi:hypothetical protein KJ359_002484 [Pestalotiopsis sp. 9143b]|nr:hypothetical protein KJ359_002484 [Pestalotiopsis sp. 9143b]
MASLLPAEGSTLAPLPEVLRSALIAVTTLAFLSFVSTAFLVIYITYRLVRWDRVVQQTKQQEVEERARRHTEIDGTNDLSLGLEERHYVYLKAKMPTPTNSEPPTPRLDKDQAQEQTKHTRWNPVLMLIYNLLCANLIEAMAFLLSGVNTYTTVVKGYKLPRTLIYTLTATVWVIAFAFPLAGILGSHNGAEHGGFYSRAGAWCWVNPDYTVFSLWLEYFWIFVAMAVTVCLLVWVLVSLQRNNQSARHFPQVLCESMEPREKKEPPKPSGHHPSFLVYQIIYIICTAPLAISRMAAMTGTKAGWVFYGIAGAMIASHGWLNVLLWSTTIVFIGDHDIRETGLEKFAFLRTPERVYGNMVMVQGGNDADENAARRWWPPRSPCIIAPSQHSRHGSEESLRRSRSLDQSVIEVEIEAKVVVEDVKSSYRGL